MQCTFFDLFKLIHDRSILKHLEAMAGLAKNAAGQALCDDRLCPQNRPAICSLRNFVALLVPFLAPQFLRLQVEGYEIFIKFLPPSATGDTLKAFFSEARDSRSPDLSRLGVWSVMAAMAVKAVMAVMAISDFFRSFNAFLQAGPIVPWLRRGCLIMACLSRGRMSSLLLFVLVPGLGS